MKKKQYLVLDPGHSMGYCVFNVDNDKMCITDYGFYDIDKSSEYMGDWCIDLENWLINKIKSTNASNIVREKYFFSGRFRTGSNVNVAYRTAIDMTARRHNLPYHEVGPSEWKYFLCGRSTPTKEQITHWGKANAKKYMSQASLWLKYQLRFPSHCISNKTNRVIKFRHDVIDAVGIAVYFARKILNLNTVTSTVINNNNITGSGKVFDYNDIVDTKVTKVVKKSKLVCIYIFQNGKKCTRVPRDQTLPILCAAHRKTKTVNTSIPTNTNTTKRRILKRVKIIKKQITFTDFVEE